MGSILPSRPGDDVIMVNQHDVLIYPDDMNPQTVQDRIFFLKNSMGSAKVTATWLIESGKLATWEQ